MVTEEWNPIQLLWPKKPKLANIKLLSLTYYTNNLLYLLTVVGLFRQPSGSCPSILQDGIVCQNGILTSIALNFFILFSAWYVKLRFSENWFNPHWHEQWKQEKCSSLALPRGIFIRFNELVRVSNYLLKSLKKCDKNSADEIWSKKRQGDKSITSHAN